MQGHVRAVPDAMERPLPSSTVLAQFSRLQRSSTFGTSQRLVELLRFVIDETISGRSASLKESIIGLTVYERNPPYDPRIDSTVRVEARRLRRKLKEYYDGEGHCDPVIISLPTGRYVPSFSAAEIVADYPEASAPGNEEGFIADGRQAGLAVMPFHAIGGDLADERFADDLTDELTFAMTRTPRLKVTSLSTAFQYRDRPYSVPEVASSLGVDVVLQGSLRHGHDQIRVTIEVSNAGGFVMWSERFAASHHESIGLRDRIANAVLTSIDFETLRPRTHFDLRRWNTNGSSAPTRHGGGNQLRAVGVSA
jgi:TolB-like protein